MSNEEAKPISIIRDSQIAISWRVKSGLNYVSQAKGMNNPDSLAEDILGAWLDKEHPDVVAHIEDKMTRDKQFRVDLKEKLGKKPPF